ncbi:DNA damage-regulated autophagy modulator protein 1 [Arapaima gigas]
MVWFIEGTCFLPTFLVIWSSSTFIVSYVVAVLRRDVDVLVPYISDTGAEPPESCIFGLMTTITAFAGAATMFARYKYVEKINDMIRKFAPRLNAAALWVGGISCLGMCFVATFQVKRTSVLTQWVHDIAAMCFFVFGVAYIILQSVISYKTLPYGSSVPVCHFRTAIATVSVLAAFPSILSADKFSVPVQQEYLLHMVSAVSEWIVTFSFVFFFFTYIREFKVTIGPYGYRQPFRIPSFSCPSVQRYLLKLQQIN